MSGGDLRRPPQVLNFQVLHRRPMSKQISGHFLENGFWQKPPFLFGTSRCCRSRIEFLNLLDASFSMFLPPTILAPSP
ncbi:unnamed protein product [Prunus armeniaca]|uniref:Uncharacterized protein n=1 Tax=Prunus armeniaca TaxID=36596 RepID=A0A6J5V6H7_PRUAR|nr:unnamed protein product [Prunus armeniaca]CAB4284579.1 unnamed protein product [Prunus armeniaca]CAB4314999.1 unnamed protein product [Prunus armeniaca]